MDRRSWCLTHGSVVNLAVASTKRSRHLTEQPRPLSRNPLCRGRRDGGLFVETRPMGPKRPNLLTIEDDENQASPPSAFDAFGLRGREADGSSSFVSSSDEEKESAGRARALQRTRTRELVQTAESVPVEAKRLSALETTSVTCKTLEVHAASVRKFCDVSEVYRLHTEFMNLLLFIGPPGLERRETVGKRPLLSNFLETGGKSTGSEVPSPQRMEKRRLRVFRDDLSPRQNWSALAVEMSSGTLAAVPTLVMFEAYLRPGEMLSLRPSEFPTERLVLQEAKLERRTTRPVSTQNDVYGWCQCSGGFRDDNHKTSLCST